MDLDNPIQTVVHHLLIRGMVYLGGRDVSYSDCTSVCDAHWIGPTMNHDARLSIFMIHQVTILHGLSTLREY